MKSQKSRLTKYASLLDWGLQNTEPREGISHKRTLLAELNAALDTDYKEQHLNNWLAARKPTPRRVHDYLSARLIETTIDDKNTKEIIRLTKR